MQGAGVRAISRAAGDPARRTHQVEANPQTKELALHPHERLPALQQPEPRNPETPISEALVKDGHIKIEMVKEVEANRFRLDLNK